MLKSVEINPFTRPRFELKQMNAPQAPQKMGLMDIVAEQAKAPIEWFKLIRETLKLYNEHTPRVLAVTNTITYLSTTIETFKALKLFSALREVKLSLGKPSEKERNYKLAASVGEIFVCTLTGIKILDKLAAIKMGTLGNALGKLPIFGQTLVAIPFSLALFGANVGVYSAKVGVSLAKIQKSNKPLKKYEDKINFWKDGLTYDVINKKIETVTKKYNEKINAFNTLEKETMNSANFARLSRLQVELNSLAAKENGWQSLKKSESRPKNLQTDKQGKWEIRKKNVQLEMFKEKKQIVLNAALATANVAMIALHLAGITTLPLAALTMTSTWFMISLYGMSNYLHDTYWLKSTPTPYSINPTAA